MINARLQAWLRDNKCSRQAFAEGIGVSPKTVQHWLYRNQRPNWKCMLKIMEVTKNNLMPNDFI